MRTNGGAAKEIVDYERDVNTALRRLHNRTHWEPTEEKTPLDALTAILEPESLSCLTLEQLQERVDSHEITLSVKLPARDYISILMALDTAKSAGRYETITLLYSYFIGDGVHPAEVLSRVYAVGAHAAIAPFCELTVRERGLMLGDSHGAQHWRMQKVCVDVVRRKGAKSWKAPGQKSLHSRRSNAIAQQGNSNRKRNRKLKSHRKKTL